jgi:glutaredoxin 3
MNITVYIKSNCPNCVAAKALLEAKGLQYEMIDADFEPFVQDLLRKHPSARQMPQIFIDGQRVGGLAGLQAALKQIERAA